VNWRHKLADGLAWPIIFLLALLVLPIWALTWLTCESGVRIFGKGGLLEGDI
jgi:hypothetical protein